MQVKQIAKKFGFFCTIVILLFIIGTFIFVYIKPQRIPNLLKSQEGIHKVNQEANSLWSKHMIGLSGVEALSEGDLKSYPAINSLGGSVWIFPNNRNMPAYIRVRISKNRNVRFILIFEPGTKPQWGQSESAIEIAPNIFVLNSSGWGGE